MADSTWVSLKELAELEVKSVNAIKCAFKRSRYTRVRKVAWNGIGKGRLICQVHIDDPCVSEPARKRYYERRLDNQNTPHFPIPDSQFPDPDPYTSAPEWARKRADKYLKILQYTEGLSGRMLREMASTLGVSYSGVMMARRIYAKFGVSGLLARYGGRKGSTKVLDEWFEEFKKLYLKEGGPSARSCWLKVLGWAIKNSLSLNGQKPVIAFPSRQAFLRRLKKEIPESAIYMARHGQQKWNRKYGSYIEREYSDVVAGDVWVSDHAQIDVAVSLQNGKLCFPWLTAWRDFKSGKILGFHLHPEPPNSDHIFQSFYNAAVTHGLPKEVYIDNGKDYRCRDFAGGRSSHRLTLDETKTRSMLALIGVRPHFALPYNPQSKNIERDFLKIKEGFSKHMSGYRGGHVKERPEALQNEIKRGEILSYDEFKRLFTSYVDDIFNKLPSAGKVHQGRSPDQVWAEEQKEIRTISRDALKLFCMRTSRSVLIRRNGICERGNWYWAEWMFTQKGRRVYMRRAPEAWQEAWVFDATTDEYIGKAELVQGIAALARTDIQRKQLREAIARKKKEHKIIKDYTQIRQRSNAGEIVSDMALSAMSLTGCHSEQREESTVYVLTNTAMDKAVLKEREMQRAGTYDLTALLPPKASLSEKHIHIFETDRDKCPVCSKKEAVNV